MGCFSVSGMDHVILQEGKQCKRDEEHGSGLTYFFLKIKLKNGQPIFHSLMARRLCAEPSSG